MSNKKRKRSIKKLKKKTKISIVVAEIFVALILLIVAVFLIVPNSKVKFLKLLTNCSAGRAFISCLGEDDYVNNILNKDYDRDKVNINNGIKKKDGYTNILLFGIDTGTVGSDVRTGNFDHANSDVMIIVSINNKTSEVRLASICRDTMLQMPADGSGELLYRKANYAYMADGPENAINMINMNFDLDITDYAVVNFNGLATIIDALGGIDLTITEDERVLINGYLTETRQITGMDAPDLTNAGAVHLTGLQATAYCRIRYTEFYSPDGEVYHSDWGRTARQRYVLSLLLEKAKAAGATQLIDVATTLLKNSSATGDKIMETSLPWDTVLDLIPVVIEANLTQNASFPTHGQYGSQPQGQTYYGYLIPSDLEHLVSNLHQFLYDKEYVPTSTVKSISNAIANITGIYYTEPDVPADQE